MLVKGATDNQYESYSLLLLFVMRIKTYIGKLYVAISVQAYYRRITRIHMHLIIDKCSIANDLLIDINLILISVG